MGGLLDDTTQTPQPTARLNADSVLPTVNTHLYPKGGLDVLSRIASRKSRLRDASGGMHDLLRRCASRCSPAAAPPTTRRRGWSCTPTSTSRSCNGTVAFASNCATPPGDGIFVDGHIIRGVAELLFAVVRDLAYTAIELGPDSPAELETSSGITDAVFRLLRNARVLHPAIPAWWSAGGGHSIGREGVRLPPNRSATSWACGLDICGLRPGRDEGR